jgi:hypothetical protein
MIHNPDPSELFFVLKVSALSWTTRPRWDNLHLECLEGRATLLEQGRPAPGDTKEGLIILLKGAATELPWPQLPGRADKMFTWFLRSLITIARLGEPAAAVEVLSCHVGYVERRMVAPNHVELAAVGGGGEQGGRGEEGRLCGGGQGVIRASDTRPARLAGAGLLGWTRYVVRIRFEFLNRLTALLT